MAKPTGKRSTSIMREQIELEAIKIDQGLRALLALAQQHENGVTGETLSVCCEQMASTMLTNVRALFNIADGEAHG